MSFLQEKIVTIGGRECSSYKISCCNRSSVSKFTVELASIVFDKEELAESCLTGKISNFQKSNPNAVAKKQLCPMRVQGMQGNNFFVQENLENLEFTSNFVSLENFELALKYVTKH